MQRHDSVHGVPGPRTHTLWWLITELLLLLLVLVEGLNREDGLKKKQQHLRRLWKTSKGLNDTLSAEAVLFELLLFFLSPPTHCAKFSLMVFVSDAIPFIMQMGWKPTGSDQTLRHADVSASFIVSEEEEAN